jgi:site-specific recombinase XerD
MRTDYRTAKPSVPKREAQPKTRWERMKKTDLTLDQLLKLMANNKLAEGKSQRLADWYGHGVTYYGRWLEKEGLPATLQHFTLDNVRAYILHLKERGTYEAHPTMAAREKRLSDYTIGTYVRALRGFSSWLCEEQYTPEPILARLKIPKAPKKVQDILCAEEIADIVTSLNPRTEIGARDQAIFLTLLDTGMRAGELCGLKLEDIHLDQGYAVVFGKGRKERPVKIGSRAAKAIRFYILHWRKPAVSSVQNVFLTIRGVTNEADALSPEAGMPLCVNALGHLLKRIGKAAGVPRLHAHLLRHTFACMYLMRYRDPFALKSLLGHTTLAMTNHYCEAVQQMDVVKADSVSVIDGLDLRFPDVNRRGRPAQKKKRG